MGLTTTHSFKVSMATPFTMVTLLSMEILGYTTMPLGRLCCYGYQWTIVISREDFPQNFSHIVPSLRHLQLQCMSRRGAVRHTLLEPRDSFQVKNKPRLPQECVWGLFGTLQMERTMGSWALSFLVHRLRIQLIFRNYFKCTFQVVPSCLMNIAIGVGP